MTASQPLSVSECALHNAASSRCSTELKKSLPTGILRDGLFSHVLRIMLESVDHPQRLRREFDTGRVYLEPTGQ